MIAQPQYRNNVTRARLQKTPDWFNPYPRILPGAEGPVTDQNSTHVLVRSDDSVFAKEGSWVREKNDCCVEPKDPSW